MRHMCRSRPMSLPRRKLPCTWMLTNPSNLKIFLSYHVIHMLSQKSRKIFSYWLCFTLWISRNPLIVPQPSNQVTKSNWCSKTMEWPNSDDLGRHINEDPCPRSPDYTWVFILEVHFHSEVKSFWSFIFWI